MSLGTATGHRRQPRCATEATGCAGQAIGDGRAAGKGQECPSRARLRQRLYVAGRAVMAGRARVVKHAGCAIATRCAFGAGRTYMLRQHLFACRAGVGTIAARFTRRARLSTRGRECPLWALNRLGQTRAGALVPGRASRAGAHLAETCGS